MENWEKEGLEVFQRQLTIVIIACLAFCIGFFFGNKNNITHPVAEIVKVDSIAKVNDSIKIKIKQLDSVKNAKIIEVQTLDNDSTLKLFYELVSK